jgi:hypothetical protein
LNEVAIIMDFRKKFPVSSGGKTTIAGIDPTLASGLADLLLKKD